MTRVRQGTSHLSRRKARAKVIFRKGLNFGHGQDYNFCLNKILPTRPGKKIRTPRAQVDSSKKKYANDDDSRKWQDLCRDRVVIIDRSLEYLSSLRPRCEDPSPHDGKEWPKLSFSILLADMGGCAVHKSSDLFGDSVYDLLLLKHMFR